MFKGEIIKKDGTRTIVEYDDKKYDIHYFCANLRNIHAIMIKRKEDGKVLELFDEKLGFIVQCNIEDETQFLVSIYKDGKCFLSHYAERNDKLEMIKELSSDRMKHSDNRLNEKIFLIQDNGGFYLYNPEKLCTSKRFHEVYNNEELKLMLGDNVILVSEEKYSYASPHIKDRITYGIDLETFEVITPIWSDLQQRFISIYTREQVELLNKKLQEKGKFINSEDYSLASITIYCEIQQTLDKLGNYLEAPVGVYDHKAANGINEEFVRKFIKREN